VQCDLNNSITNRGPISGDIWWEIMSTPMLTFFASMQSIVSGCFRRFFRPRNLNWTWNCTHTIHAWYLHLPCSKCGWIYHGMGDANVWIRTFYPKMGSGKKNCLLFDVVQDPAKFSHSSLYYGKVPTDSYIPIPSMGPVYLPTFTINA